MFHRTLGILIRPFNWLKAFQFSCFDLYIAFSSHNKINISAWKLKKTLLPKWKDLSVPNGWKIPFIYIFFQFEVGFGPHTHIYNSFSIFRTSNISRPICGLGCENWIHPRICLYWKKNIIACILMSNGLKCTQRKTWNDLVLQ